MSLSKICLWTAALLAFAVLLAHEFAGAPMVLPPLSAANLPDEIVWLHHFSWHVGSIAIFAMIALFVYPALRPSPPFMAMVASAMSLSFALLAVGLAIWGSASVWSTPAPYVWWPIALLGGIGAATGGHTP